MSKTESAKMLVLALLCLMATACSGGGGSSSATNGGGPGVNAPVNFQISGYVRSSGKAVPGVKLLLDKPDIAPVFTNSSGHYVFRALSNGHYLITPQMPGYACAPLVSFQIVNGADIPNVNFDLTLLTYQISGAVTSAGTALTGVKVTLDNSGVAPAFTDSSGHYLFSGLANGNYTVIPEIPAKKGYSCSPKATSLTINGASITNVDFTQSVSSPLFYLCDDAGALGTVNMSTGEVNLIGTTSVALLDIAFDSSGNLYGISLDSLYRIDKSNAALTLIGRLNTTDATSLASGPGGLLYTASDQLFSVNAATGAATAIGNGASQYLSSGDLEFVGNQLYLSSKIPVSATDYSDLVDTNLLKLNAATGAATLVGPIGFPRVFGLATNDNVSLYGFSRNSVISIDPATGAGTLLWDLSGKGLSNINGAAAE